MITRPHETRLYTDNDFSVVSTYVIIRKEEEYDIYSARIITRTRLIERARCTLPTYQTKRFQSNEETTKSDGGGYAKAYEKFENIKDQPNKSTPQSFVSLLKNSRLIDLGDPEKKVVTGKIFHIVEDDLYIDFGWKFHCVCPRPKNNAESYIRGAKVRLVIKDLELSSKFLGFEKDLTLLEADCFLLGLVQERSQNKITE